MAEHRHSDKRGFHRIIHHADAFAHTAETQVPCKVLDVSLKGCLVEFPNGWAGSPETVNRIEILLEGGLAIDMGVSLSHAEKGHAGYRCDHIDLDSVCVLRRMIELNLGDSQLLDRDLRALLHSRSAGE